LRFTVGMFVVFAEPERTVFVEIARIRTFVGANQEGPFFD